MSRLIKFAIYGSYGGSSTGDTAILLGLICALDRVYPDGLEINILTVGYMDLEADLKALGVRVVPKQFLIHNKSNRGFGRFLYLTKTIFNKISYQFPYKSKVVRQALSDVNFLIIGGGNLVMDYYPNWPVELYKVCKTALGLKVPYGFIGVGLGPINTIRGKILLKKSLSSARCIYFRDANSKKNSESIFSLQNVETIPDLALAIPRFKSIDKAAKTKLLVNVAGLFDKEWPVRNAALNKAYISKLVALVDFIANKKKITCVEIFNSNHGDVATAKVFFNELKEVANNYQVINEASLAKSVFQLIDRAKESQFILATRLHAGIIGYLCGCRVISIAYQSKVKDVIDYAGLPTVVVGLDELVAGDYSQELDFSTMEIDHLRIVSEIDRIVKSLSNE